MNDRMWNPICVRGASLPWGWTPAERHPLGQIGKVRTEHEVCEVALTGCYRQ